MDFTHLHVHSHYSLLDGVGKIGNLVARTKALGMKNLALTDHGVLYGLVEFYQKAKEAGIKPILGMEAYVAPNSHKDKRPKIDVRPYHLVLLARNFDGYKNLIQLTTKAHLDGYYYKPRIDLELLKEHAGGLAGLSACLQGAVPRAILSGNMTEAERIACLYREILGQDNFYLELEHNPSIPEQKTANDGLVKLSRKTGIPLVATNDVHYINPDDNEAQDILVCVQTGKTVDDRKRLNMSKEDFSLKSPDEMARWFAETPEAVENTGAIAEKCNVELPLGELVFPEYALPANETPETYLRQLAEEGLKRRYGQNWAREHARAKEIRQRFEYELSTIQETGFSNYTLIVQDFVNYAKQKGILVGPGRGSAAGSLISFALNITGLDPIEYDLLFERYLNPERISPPDVDLDFADDRRDEVIQYVANKYGQDHVAQIITFGTMAPRAAVRDAGRSLGYPYNFCDQVAKLIPMFMNFEEALEREPELRKMYDSDPEAKRLIDAAKRLEGVARHASTHACGVVITKKPLTEYVPLQKASQDDQSLITQYSLHPIEDLGLLKMDFLGLKNLTILQNAIKIIEKRHNASINLEKIPLDDKETFNLLAEARTTGVFQLESSGMKRYLKQLKPSVFEDIISMVALYRPGPMENIPDFIAGKNGQREITYLHPKLKPILEKTYGVIVTQEQVLQIARELAGFSYGEADVLRKAVGKKIKSLLDEQRDKFIKAAVENKVDRNTAGQVWEFIEPFARYGFNRAHAACYAMIGYETAYLKAHYPAEFMAALLTSDQDNIDRVAIEVAECEQMGLTILPPDVNQSFDNFTVVDRHDKETGEKKAAIRFGLAAVKNVGRGVIEAVVSARKKDGEFKTLDEFLARVESKDLNKKSLESLAKCGALNKLAERNQVLENIEGILKFIKVTHRAKANGQADLFASLSKEAFRPVLHLREVPKAGKKDRLAWEKELLGLYVSEHPIDDYREYLSRRAMPITNLTTGRPGEQVSIGGVITKIHKVLTRQNQPMIFATVEDTTGNIEVLVFPSLLAENQEIWQEDKIVLITGKMSDKEGDIKLLVDAVEELKPEALEKFNQEKNNQPEAIEIIVPPRAAPGFFDKIKKSLEQANQGSQKVILVVDEPQKPQRIETSFNIQISPQVRQELENIVGRGKVR